jgi:drug/metabolite transporter (DMT)-like permease
MNPSLATISALGAAVLFAVATAVQSRAIRDAGQRASGSRRPAGRSLPIVARRELGVLRQAVWSGAWLAGSALAVVAFGLHALALHEGDLTLVQPLLVTMVLFALPASWAIGGTAISLSDLFWALVLVLGLTAFFAAARPAASGTGADFWPALMAAGLAALAIAFCLLLARSRPGGESAALLGGAAGIAFAGVAGLVKVVTHQMGQGPGAVVGAWQVYALVFAGATGIALTQLAYRAGPLSASLPAMNCVNPLVSVLIGVAVFDEHFRTGLLASSAEFSALGVMTVATVLLSRRPHVDRPVPARPLHHQPAAPG